MGNKPRLYNEKGRVGFLAGNPGRPPGTVSKEKQELAQACRDVFIGHFDRIVQIIEKGRDDDALKAMKFMAERGWGSIPKVVKLGVEEDGPLGLLAEIQRKRLEREEQKMLNAVTTELVPDGEVSG